MIAAILISGYLRNYVQGVEYIKTEIMSKFDKCDIYLHITQNESVEDVYDNHVDSIEDWKKIKEQLLPVAVIVEANDNLYQDKLSNNTHNQWSKLHLLNLLRGTFTIMVIFEKVIYSTLWILYIKVIMQGKLIAVAYTLRAY